MQQVVVRGCRSSQDMVVSGTRRIYLIYLLAPTRQQDEVMCKSNTGMHPGGTPTPFRHGDTIQTNPGCHGYQPTPRVVCTSIVAMNSRRQVWKLRPPWAYACSVPSHKNRTYSDARCTIKTKGKTKAPDTRSFEAQLWEACEANEDRSTRVATSTRCQDLCSPSMSTTTSTATPQNLPPGSTGDGARVLPPSGGR